MRTTFGYFQQLDHSLDSSFGLSVEFECRDFQIVLCGVLGILCREGKIGKALILPPPPASVSTTVISSVLHSRLLFKVTSEDRFHG